MQGSVNPVVGRHAGAKGLNRSARNWGLLRRTNGMLYVCVTVNTGGLTVCGSTEWLL